MDIAKDMLDAAEKVGLAPGLSLASYIVVGIIRTVETCNVNKKRLTSLAQSITDQLLSISESMHGKWDTTPHELKQLIDEFVAILREILKVVTKVSKYSQIRALLTAGDCEKDITLLEKRLGDVQRKIMLLVGVSTLVLANQTHSGVQHLMEEVERLRLEVHSTRPDPDFRTYTREDIRLMHTISQRVISHSLPDKDRVIVTLYQAQRRADGQDVLVKKYDGLQREVTRKVFEKDLEMYKHVWIPGLLQFVGGSRSLERIPFQVYQSLGDWVEPFYEWVPRTIRSNPVETLLGLYDMRTSLKDLAEFGRRHSVRCDFRGSVVSIQRQGNRKRHSLVYAAEIERGSSNAFDYKYRQMNELGRFCRYLEEVNSAVMLAAAFCGGSKAWFDSLDGTDALVKVGFDTLDMLQLGSMLFERGWLGPSSTVIEYRENLALGDVGYITQDGNFEVVKNLHASLQSKDGATPQWRTWMMSNDQQGVIEDTAKYSGKVYKRYTIPHLSNQACGCSLTYTDLDKQHAWNALRQQASRIVDVNGLSIAPVHQLLLVTDIQKWSHVCIVDTEEPELRELGTLFRRGFIFDVTKALPMMLYRFEEGAGVRLRESGTPEMDWRAHYSSQSTLDALDEKSWYEERMETRDCYCLWYHTFYIIEYLQLPPGIARSSYMEDILS